jgi:hypothetical protein
MASVVIRHNGSCRHGVDAGVARGTLTPANASDSTNSRTCLQADDRWVVGDAGSVNSAFRREPLKAGVLGADPEGPFEAPVGHCVEAAQPGIVRDPYPGEPPGDAAAVR